MIHDVASIEIDCSIDEVFNFISDARNRTKYDPDLIEVRQSPEWPVSVGTRIVEVRRAMGVTREMVTEVSDLKPNQLIGFRTLKGDPSNAFGSYHMASVPEGTRLTLDFTLDSKGLMKLAQPFIKGKLKRDTAIGLSNIKAILENRSGNEE